MFYFLVYNDNTHSEHNARLLATVKKYGPEFKTVVFDKGDMDPAFVERHKAILTCPRGGGYWLWKPYIINEMLKRMNPGDVVFYLDSKYYFLEPFAALYSPYLNDHDILVWKNKPNGSSHYMKHWCKMDVVRKYGMRRAVFNRNAEDAWAGAIVLKKTARTERCVHDWLTMACVPENITDSKSVLPNWRGFKEHRHDQSLWSIVLHKNNVPLHFFENKYLQNVRQPF